MTNDDSSKFECQTCLLNNKNNTEDKVECEWFINSPKHFNCFWLYVLDQSGPDGSMPEMTQAEIAHLMGWSNTKTHFMLKQATKDLIEALTKFRAKQLLESNGPQQEALLSSDIDPLSNYNSDTEE